MTSHLSMNAHISYVVRTAFPKFCEILNYRKFLKSSATVCCTAFPRNPSTGCRVFSTLQPGWWSWQGNTPVLRELHWLAAEFQTQYKINLQVFESSNNMSPRYLSEKLKLKNSNGPRKYCIDSRVWFCTRLSGHKRMMWEDKTFFSSTFNKAKMHRLMIWIL